jgi:thiamine kinase-like enzyme
MPGQFINAVAKKENNLFCRILSDLITEKEGPQLQNKHLLIQLLILKIYHPNDFQAIPGGHSNDTYFYREENLVLRFPKAYNPFFPELSIEIQNLHSAQLLNLTPLKTIAYYEKYSVLVTEFIPNYQSLTIKDFKNPAKLMALAHLIKKLHYSTFNFKKNTETAMAVIDKSSQCFHTIQPILSKKDHSILKKLLGIKNFLEKSYYPKLPAHGDLHHFNVIEINGQLQLMDWELSSLEDPAYDISRLFCVTRFNSAQKEIFFKTYSYVGHPILSEDEIKNLIKRVFLYESLNNFSIVIWSKYAMPYVYDDQQHLLTDTIVNFSQQDKLIDY